MVFKDREKSSTVNLLNYAITIRVRVLYVYGKTILCEKLLQNTKLNLEMFGSTTFL